MSYLLPIAIGLLMLAVKLLPVALLLFAAVIAARRLAGAPARLLSIGAVLLAIASLDSVASYFIALLLEGAAIANLIVYSSVLFEALNVISLILISIGLIKLAKGATMIPASG